MNRIHLVEQTIGGRWTGVKFENGNNSSELAVSSSLRFCEAIKESYAKPIRLLKRTVECPGALRSFGWSKNGENGDSSLAKRMAENMDIDESTARKLIDKVPRFTERISHVTLGDIDSPDIILSFAQPEAAMNIMTRYQKITGEHAQTIISSTMSVCGWVAVGGYLLNRISMSFGCPVSREKAEIGKDRLVIGLPAGLVERLLKREWPLTA